MCPAKHGMIHSAFPCRHPISFTKAGRYGLTFKSFFMWSRIVDRGIPSSDHRFRVDFIGERSVEAATTAHVSKRFVFLPLRGLSLTLQRANARFAESSSVVLRGGALVNRSRNAAVTWDGLSRVLSLMHPYTYHLSAPRQSNCLCQPYGKQLNSVAAAYHVCTILGTVAKLPFYIVLRAVLCKLKLSLRCVLSGCTVTSRPFCTGVQWYNGTVGDVIVNVQFWRIGRSDRTVEHCHVPVATVTFCVTMHLLEEIRHS